jgi:2-amino-4-hydroxy-6-hydroxymethyldihydropteridine diphosphokinase
MPFALAYLSLGSNLGDRKSNLLRASEELANACIQVVHASSIYETEPQDFIDQPAFLNCVLAVQSELSPFALLGRTHAIEAAMGRTRSEILKGPRVIDIDILLIGALVLQDERLIIPHPRMLNRRFVLEPLVEIAADLRHPGTGALLRDALPGVSDQWLRPA